MLNFAIGILIGTAITTSASIFIIYLLDVTNKMKRLERRNKNYLKALRELRKEN